MSLDGKQREYCFCKWWKNTNCSTHGFCKVPPGLSLLFSWNGTGASPQIRGCNAKRIWKVAGTVAPASASVEDAIVVPWLNTRIARRTYNPLSLVPSSFASCVKKSFDLFASCLRHRMRIYTVGINGIHTSKWPHRPLPFPRRPSFLDIFHPGIRFLLWCQDFAEHECQICVSVCNLPPSINKVCVYMQTIEAKHRRMQCYRSKVSAISRGFVRLDVTESETINSYGVFAGQLSVRAMFWPSLWRYSKNHGLLKHWQHASKDDLKQLKRPCSL